MDTWYPGLGDFVDAASSVLGASPEAIRRLPNLKLAESALAVPRQGFGERTAFLLFGFFLRENGRPWPDDDDLGDAEMVERAASGETTHDELVAWVRSRLA